MTILVDPLGHLVSDTSLQELHEFAENLGLKREWFQSKRSDHPHYDLLDRKWKPNKRLINKAVELGAHLVRPRDVLKAVHRMNRIVKVKVSIPIVEVIQRGVYTAIALKEVVCSCGGSTIQIGQPYIIDTCRLSRPICYTCYLYPTKCRSQSNG